MASDIWMDDVISPLREVYNRELRNAIFHSDYALHGGEIRLIRGPRDLYSSSEIQSLINKSLAYFETMNNLVQAHIMSYKSPKIVVFPPTMYRDPDLQVITIVRKGHGVIGLKDNWSKEEIARGKIAFSIGRFLPYEMEMIKRNRSLTILPHNRIEIVNRGLKFFPDFIRKRLVTIIMKHRLLARISCLWI